MVLTVKDVERIFNCCDKTARKKMKFAREKLNKRTSNNGRRGADSLTYEQLVYVFGLDKPEKK